MLEIQRDQIRDVEIPPIGSTCSFEKDMRDVVADFQPAITCEAVIERDPAKGESFSCTWTFEIFVESALIQGTGARPAITGHNKGRKVGFIAYLVHQI